MDDIIIFHSLTGDSFQSIARKMLDDLVKRLDEQEIVLTMMTKYLIGLLDEGTDADFGARPLKRFIQRHVETIVAKELIRAVL